jgi:hypothetical protein
MNAHPGLTLVFFMVVATACDAEKLPDPSEYPAVSMNVATPAKPVLKSRLARLYRTRINEGAKAGPNFAGHYTVVRWGCGAGAFMFFVVDAVNGAVYEPPEVCIALSGDEAENLPGFGNHNPGFSLTSKLLLTVGVEDGPKDEPYGRAKTVYLFDKGRFKRLYKEHAPL